VTNVKTKLDNYNKIFIERENGVLFLKELVTLHTLQAAKMDENHLQDMEFERLMAKLPTRANSLTENEIN
jgi:hypothetical protein